MVFNTVLFALSRRTSEVIDGMSKIKNSLIDSLLYETKNEYELIPFDKIIIPDSLKYLILDTKQVKVRRTFSSIMGNICTGIINAYVYGVLFTSATIIGLGALCVTDAIVFESRQMIHKICVEKTN